MIDRIGKIESPDNFTDLCNSIFAEEFFDFQVIDDSGGDAGNDGYSEEKKILFQYYCPSKQLKITDTKLKTKIKKDLSKAKKLIESKKYDIEKWIFVTPMSLRENVQTFIREEARKIGLDGISWSKVKLSNLLAKYSHLRSQFPDLIFFDIEHQLSKIDEKMDTVVAKKTYSYEDSIKDIKNNNELKFEFTSEQKSLIDKINEVHVFCGKTSFDFKRNYRQALNHITNKPSEDWYECAAKDIAQAMQDIDFFSAFEEVVNPKELNNFNFLKAKINYIYDRLIQELRHTNKRGQIEKQFKGPYYDILNKEPTVTDSQYEDIFEEFQKLLVELFKNFKLKKLII